ncbi:MAG TPA: outer membrane lipoprotein chaperone LolA [Gammaproteobacteria bacterium]|nr:outer membrane lipoprotein chaperone LolA [Gammaproteobacteria bacterium]
MCNSFRSLLRHAGLLLCLWPGLAAQAGSDNLVGRYFADLRSFHAQFVQTVVDSNGEQVQDSKGEVWIEKPGRFRWDYRTPYRQLIVADGKRLWTWDEDLEQATVKTIDEALSSTPAMLLSGFRPLSEVMTWKPLENEDSMQWFSLSPRQADAAVESVRMAFAGGNLSIIEVVDDFGNRTRIVFSDTRRNQPVDPGLFELKLPPGTDIIGAEEP